MFTKERTIALRAQCDQYDQLFDTHQAVSLQIRDAEAAMRAAWDAMIQGLQGPKGGIFGSYQQLYSVYAAKQAEYSRLFNVASALIASMNNLQDAMLEGVQNLQS